MDYTQSPAYKRYMARIDRISPDQRAVLNTLSPDREFAGKEFRRGLQAKGHEAGVDFANRRLGLREKRFDETMGLRREGFGYGQEQEDIATGVGLGNIAASTQFGLQKQKLDADLDRKKLALLKIYGV